MGDGRVRGARCYATGQLGMGGVQATKPWCVSAADGHAQQQTIQLSACRELLGAKRHARGQGAGAGCRGRLRLTRFHCGLIVRVWSDGTDKHRLINSAPGGSVQPRAGMQQGMRCMSAARKPQEGSTPLAGASWGAMPTNPLAWHVLGIM